MDRQAELSEWADTLGKIKVTIYVYANNHYAGYSPATVEMFRNLWGKQVGPVEPGISMTHQAPEQGRLFE